MALRNVVKKGDPVLTKKCREVTAFDERLWQLLDDMAETMLEENGLGLAAPQVGVRRRVFVAMDEPHFPDDATDEELEAYEPLVYECINPEILEEEGSVLSYEGCLSFPGDYAAIKRPRRVKIKAQDRDGEEFILEAEGMLARCLCHENNHLDGITIEDLAEYYYDPEEPRPLDKVLEGEDEDECAEQEMAQGANGEEEKTKAE